MYKFTMSSKSANQCLLRGALLVIGVGVSSLLATVADMAPAVADSQVIVAPPGGTSVSWSDCIHDDPQPPSDAEVAVFTITNGVAPGTYYLDCGGVRHINTQRGFNHYTEDCINGIT